MTDRNEIDCPRAKTWMTPCIARDGSTALSDLPLDASEISTAFTCVGCGADPRVLLKDLAERHKPARRFVQTKDPVLAADRLTEQVAAYVESKS